MISQIRKSGRKIYSVPDEEVWKTRLALKNKLINYIRNQFRDTWLKNQGDPSRVVSLMDKINPNALLIGFARRFATYKRAHLLFTDWIVCLRLSIILTIQYSSCLQEKLTRTMAQDKD